MSQGACEAAADARPNLQGLGALVNQHGQAVGPGRPRRPRAGADVLGRIVDHVEDRRPGRGRPAEVDRRGGSSGTQAGAGRIDHDRARPASPGAGRIEARTGIAPASGPEFGQERVAGRGGAVRDPQGGTAAVQGFHGGAAGGAARAPSRRTRAPASSSPSVARRPCGQAVAVGVESAPAGGRGKQRVDGADRPGRLVDRGDAAEGDDFVRDGEIEAAKTLRRAGARGRAADRPAAISKRKYFQPAKRGSRRLRSASAALCMRGLSECAMGWPSTASLEAPGATNASRSARVRTLEL